MTSNIMSNKNKRSSSKRQYPEFYEKTVPVAIGVLTIFIVVIIVIAIGVVLGVSNGAG